MNSITGKFWDAYNSSLAFGFTEEQTDWRDPSLRHELFNRYFRFRILSHDLDHTHYMKDMCEDYDYERKAWFSFCFGMTYRTPQCFAYTETFESINDVTEEWHRDNWKRTSYGTDARYNKGHFFSQVQSVRDWIGGKTFQQKIEGIIVHDTQRENFWALYNEIISLYKFGRMTTWLAMQALHDLLELPIDPEDIMLDGFGPNNDSSLQSIWNGLCAYENTPEKMVGGMYGNYVCNEKDIAHAKEALLHYTSLAEENAGFKIDSFRKESIWCQYKRLFNAKQSKEYPGHASGDATSRYLYYREHWPEIDWSKFRKSLRSQPGTLKGMTYVKEFNEIFGQTGLLLNMDGLYSDMPNVYDILGIDHNHYRVKEIWEDDDMKVPDKFDFMEDLKETPRRYNEDSC